jgi:hypothetical protein
MAEHALLPWSESDGYLFAGNNTVYLRSGTYEWACDQGGPHYETAVANAAFIVKACNLHDELVAALKAVIDATRAYLPPDGIPQDELINRVLAATDNPRINAALIAAERG